MACPDCPPTKNQPKKDLQRLLEFSTISHSSTEFPGLRMIGELRMQGKTAEDIADAVNAAGYRTGSKRFGARPFTIDTINAITRCEFYAAFAPGDDRGTVVYKDQRFRGQHPAAFTYEEWERIRIGTRMNYKAPQRSEQAHRIYEFSGYIVCVHCGLNLRCRGASANVDYSYYKDMAKARQYDCPAGGYLQVRTDLVAAQFGDLLQGLRLPPYWREIIREKMLEAAKQTGVDTEAIEREKERLKLKRGRILKQHREGYIDDEEFEGEMAAVELALHALEVPELDGISLDEVIAAGERLPGMAALWSVATVEERRDIVMLILKPGGLHYDVEMKEIAAITPRPVFLPVLRLLEGVIEYEEATGTLVTRRWQQRNRRASDDLQDALRDRQTSKASLSPGRLTVFLLRIISQVCTTDVFVPKVWGHRNNGSISQISFLGSPCWGNFGWSERMPTIQRSITWYE